MTWSRLGGARRRNRTGGCLHSAVLSACGVCMCVLGGVSVFVFQPTGPTGNRARGSLALLKRDIYSIVQLAFDRILMLYRVCPGWHQRIAADHRWCSTGCTEPRVCCRLLPTRRHSPWWHSCLRTPAATAPAPAQTHAIGSWRGPGGWRWAVGQGRALSFVRHMHRLHVGHRVEQLTR